jgi:CNP1-like family
VHPEYPRRERLVPFFVSSASSFRFFVDSASLSTGADGVVRYALVVRSTDGAETITYEGIRCATSEYRVYATGVGGAWSPAAGAWRKIEPRSVQRWHNALYKEYLCPLGNPIRSSAEGVNALRSGDHPSRRPTGP